MKKSKDIRAYDIKTHEYPGFSTDLQSPYVVLMTQAKGVSLIQETIYDRRLLWADYAFHKWVPISLCAIRTVLLSVVRLNYTEKN
jgi:UDP-N-acetylglucosamine 1-carboxyvinyltransferase